MYVIKTVIKTAEHVVHGSIRRSVSVIEFYPIAIFAIVTRSLKRYTALFLGQREKSSE